MIFSIQEIEQRFSHQLVEAGKRLIDRGEISTTEVQRGGELITAVIQQAGERPLRLYIRIVRKGGETAIHGECGCEAEGECIHVVAALIHAMDGKRFGGVAEPAAGGDASATAQSERLLSRQCLLYILHLDDNALAVESCVARRLAQGGHEFVSRFEPACAKGTTPARFLEPVDIELLKVLDSSPLGSVSRFPLLDGILSTALFERLLTTGRCYLDAIECGMPLRLGEPRDANLYWQADIFGRQRLVCQISPPAELILQFASPWYLDRMCAVCAPLSCVLNREGLRELSVLPPFEQEQAREWLASFRERHPGLSIPAPQVFAQRTLPPVRPQPCLSLRSKGESGVETSRYACLTFDYAGIELAPTAPDSYLRDGQLFQIERDDTAERTAMAQLLDMGLEIDRTDEFIGTYLFPVAAFPQTIEQAWIDFQLHAIPRLRKQGWRIEFDGFPQRLVEANRWTCNVERLERRDWFSLSLDLDVEGRRVKLLPLLLQLLESLPPERQEIERLIGHHLLLPLEDIDGNACLLRISGAQALHILELLLEIGGGRRQATERPLEINRAQLVRLAPLDSESATCYAPIHWSDEESRKLIGCLSALERIPSCTPPMSLLANLRPYQQQGLAWLQFLREFRLAGILADDMGLGKTLQTLAHLLLEKETGRADRPSLVVVPTSLTFNWFHETRRFAPGLRFLLLHGAQRKKHFRRLGDYDLIVTTYSLLTRDCEALKAQNYHLLILDEAQTIKNPKAQTSQAVKMLKARHRLCLTGTPLENHLGELWSLFDFLMPGLLGDEKGFRRDYRLPIERHGDEAIATRLSQRLRPFLLRRTKRQVAKELPEKSEFIQSVVLEGAQRELYETVRLSMHRRVREEIERQGLARSQIVVLDALLKLRQVCCDPRLLKSEKLDTLAQSAKLTYLMTLLEEMVEEGRQILLFSQFTAMLTLIEGELRRIGIDYVKLTGRTRDRETPVKRFQRGEAPLFLISLKAGGVGLNLTAADTVIHYDPWWNPAVERQATDRSHRIGQTQKVFVYKLICEGTVEEKILAMQQYKQRLADGLYREDDTGALPWSEEDIETLFTPLHDA